MVPSLTASTVLVAELAQVSRAVHNGLEAVVSTPSFNLTYVEVPSAAVMFSKYADSAVGIVP